MGSKVFFYDPFLTNQKNTIPRDIRIDKLSKLLKESDLVVTSVTLNESTYKMVNKKFLDRMKDGAVLVNSSRGDVVDEMALLNALKTKKLSACALDVISNENNSNFLVENELIKYAKENDNLIITPHIAGLSSDSETKAQKAAFKLVLDYLGCQ